MYEVGILVKIAILHDIFRWKTKRNLINYKHIHQQIVYELYLHNENQKGN